MCSSCVSGLRRGGKYSAFLLRHLTSRPASPVSILRSLTVILPVLPAPCRYFSVAVDNTLNVQREERVTGVCDFAEVNSVSMHCLVEVLTIVKIRLPDRFQYGLSISHLTAVDLAVEMGRATPCNKRRNAGDLLTPRRTLARPLCKSSRHVEIQAVDRVIVECVYAQAEDIR